MYTRQNLTQEEKYSRLISKSHDQAWANKMLESYVNNMEELDREEASKFYKGLKGRKGPAAICAEKVKEFYLEEYGYDGKTLDSLISSQNIHIKKEFGEDGGVYFKDEKTIIMDYRTKVCICPLIGGKYITFEERKDVNLCECSTKMWEVLYEEVAGKPCKCTVVESCLRGSDRCVWSLQLP